MWATKIIRVGVRIIQIPLMIVSLVTTFVGGILMALPLIGLLFVLLTTLVWLPFLGALLLLGWLWFKSPPFMHPLLAVCGIPVSLLGVIYVSLVPGGADPEDQIAKHVKSTLCQQWPWAWVVGEEETLVRQVMREERRGYFRAVFRIADMLARRDYGILW